MTREKEGKKDVSNTPTPWMLRNLTRKNMIP